MESSNNTSSGFKTPDTLVILFGVALLAWAATWLVPAGRFVSADGGFSLDSFEYVGVQPAFLFSDGERTSFLGTLFDGLVAGDRYSATVGLMAFLLIVGGAFGIIMRTGAMEAALLSLLQRPGERTALLAPSLFVLFSLGGAVFGMGEEAIVFVMILAPAFARAGFDSLTVLLVTYVGTQIGFATSWMNPFSVVIAQGIAGLDTMSGAGFRMLIWSVFTFGGAALVYRYAARVARTPTNSRMYSADHWLREQTSAEVGVPKFALGHGLILLIIFGGIGWVAWGVAINQYYFPEIASQFFAMGLAAACVARLFRLNNMDFNDCAEAFRDGAIQLAPAAIIIGFAKGVVLLLGGDQASEPSVLNTALYSMAQLTEGLPGHIAGLGMFILQSVINLFVVSGSGQAALTMPLMAPLSDLIGVERQTAVLAFQLGDGLMNLIVPSSAGLMGCLAAARVPWGVWIQFFWKGMALAMGGAAIFILMAVSIGYA